MVPSPAAMRKPYWRWVAATLCVVGSWLALPFLIDIGPRLERALPLVLLMQFIAFTVALWKVECATGD